MADAQAAAAGNTPSTTIFLPLLQELMSQAAWNLCPQKTAYDASCYYGEDQAFSAIAGSTHITLPDVSVGLGGCFHAQLRRGSRRLQ